MPSSPASRPVSAQQIAAWAARLAEAEATGRPIAPLSTEIGEDDLDTAYAIADVNIAAAVTRGRRVVGHKIGLTSKVIQEQFGLTHPDFGRLLDDMAFTDGSTIAWRRVLQPRVETEVALVLGSDLRSPDCTVDEVAAAVARVHASFEIVGSRIADWRIKGTDTIADNGSAAGFVLGKTSIPLDRLDVDGGHMEMRRNGEIVSDGRTSACLGGPALSCQWLAREMARRGSPLRAGDIILTGALGRMVAAEPGDTFSAEITGLGGVSITFGR